MKIQCQLSFQYNYLFGKTLLMAFDWQKYIFFIKMHTVPASREHVCKV